MTIPNPFNRSKTETSTNPSDYIEFNITSFQAEQLGENADDSQLSHLKEQIHAFEALKNQFPDASPQEQKELLEKAHASIAQQRQDLEQGLRSLFKINDGDDLAQANIIKVQETIGIFKGDMSPHFGLR